MKLQSSRRRWAIPFSAGVAACLIGWVEWRRLHPPLDPVILDLARDVGANPQDLTDCDDLLEKVEQKGTLSEQEWQRLTELFANDNQFTKREALGVMMTLDKTSYRSQILALSKPLLQNPHWQLQNGALILLRRFGDPSWRAESTKRLNSPDEDIRSNAQVQLRLGSESSRRPTTP
jgi:hypothetical protein